MNEHIVELSEQNFDAVVTRGGNTPVLIDFWAPWCGPCRAVAPILEQLATELHGQAVIAKLNVDEQPRLAGAANIQAIPTLAVVKNGAVVDVAQGLQPKARLVEMLKRHM